MAFTHAQHKCQCHYLIILTRGKHRKHARDDIRSFPALRAGVTQNTLMMTSPQLRTPFHHKPSSANVPLGAEPFASANYDALMCRHYLAESVTTPFAIILPNKGHDMTTICLCMLANRVNAP